jgi:chlorobactene glucosyltransferase
MMGSIRKYTCIPVRPWEVGASSELVSVVVPCRNEAHNVDRVVPSLLAQDYPHLEFLFLDDRSTDGTPEKLRAWAARDRRVRVLEGAPLPEGWTGKNHAMAQAARAARGAWLLFTDADTVHEPHSLSSAVHYARGRGLDLLTLSARCVCESFAEHLIQPMGIGCFSVWFKLEEVNDPSSRTPLCCGQYLLVRREAYEAVGGSGRVRAEVTEDLALFEAMKHAGYRCELSIGSHLFSTRMYRSLRESWLGWRRIYLHGLRKNVPSILSKIAMLVFFSFAPFAVAGWAAGRILLGDGAWWPALGLAGGLCGFILFLRSRSHATLKTAQWSVLLHPLSALVIAAILVDCLAHHFAGRKVEWKLQKY